MDKEKMGINVKYRKKRWLGNSWDIHEILEIPEFEIPKILIITSDCSHSDKNTFI